MTRTQDLAAAAQARADQAIEAWRGVLLLFPGTRAELGRRLGLTRQGLANLRNLVHLTVPHQLLRKLAKVLRRPADGSRPPTQQQLTRRWLAAKAAATGVADAICSMRGPAR